MNIRVVHGMVINLDKLNFCMRDEKNVLLLGFDNGTIEIQQRDGADVIEAFLKGQDGNMVQALQAVATDRAQHEVPDQEQRVSRPQPLQAADLDPHGITTPLVQANIARGRGFVPAMMPDKNAQ